MKSSRPVLVYTLLRLLAFVVPFGVALALGAPPWVAALLGAMLGLCVSLLMFRRQREAVALRIHERRAGSDTVAAVHGTDEDAEDAAVAPSTPSPMQ